MKTLILGQGGREHALAATLALDSEVQEVLVYPGNAGISGNKIKLLEGHFSNADLAEYALKNKIGLVVVGPENRLQEGVVDVFEEAGIPIYGPTEKAAQLESSKIFAKRFMQENQISTARFFESYSKNEALEVLQKNEVLFQKGVVIKLSGLHAGKGVFVTSSIADAKKEIEQLESQNSKLFSEGILLEERLFGKEVSVFYSCLEDRYIFLGEACDHKRLLDQDQGPNTGGMGAYSPCPWLTDQDRQFIEEKILKPTLAGMIQRKTPFSGTLFLGLMVGENPERKISVIEYNVRFGDPETQTLLPLLKGSLFQAFLAVAKKDFSEFEKSKFLLSRKVGKSVHVVKVAENYPQAPVKGDEIKICSNLNPAVPLFFAGVDKLGDKLITAGGRVLGATAVSDSYENATKLAYQELAKTSFRGEFFRKDIAKAALPIQIAILASGSGSNALKLAEKAASLSRIRLACVVVDKPSSALLSEENKKKLCAPVYLIEKTKGMTREDHEKKIEQVLKEHRSEWVLLAGYMRIFSSYFIGQFKNHVINIHPSLLPAFPGMAGYEQAFNAGVSESGVTIHFVDEGVDTGPVWKQAKFKREKHDTLDSFTQKGKMLEWKLYPEFLEWLEQR